MVASPNANPTPEPQNRPWTADRPRPGRRHGFLIVRGLMLALTLTIGIVLLTRGNALLGVLITVLAVVRIGMLASLSRRRDRWRATITARRGGFDTF